MNVYAKWFSRVVWLGIVSNFALAIPTLFVPDKMLSLFHLEPAFPLVWLRFAANLLILLSLFYTLAAINPYYYQKNAWLAVFSRLAGFTFFLFQPKAYLIFGLYDLTFAIPEGILLMLALRSVTTAEPHPYQETKV